MEANRVLSISYFDVDQLKPNFTMGFHRKFDVEELIIVSDAAPLASTSQQCATSSFLNTASCFPDTGRRFLNDAPTLLPQ
jgi:hypothetical protein